MGPEMLGQTLNILMIMIIIIIIIIDIIIYHHQHVHNHNLGQHRWGIPGIGYLQRGKNRPHLFYVHGEHKKSKNKCNVFYQVKGNQDIIIFRRICLDLAIS